MHHRCSRPACGAAPAASLRQPRLARAAGVAFGGRLGSTFNASGRCRFPPARPEPGQSFLVWASCCRRMRRCWAGHGCGIAHGAIDVGVRNRCRPLRVTVIDSDADHAVLLAHGDSHHVLEPFARLLSEVGLVDGLKTELRSMMRSPDSRVILRIRANALVGWLFDAGDATSKVRRAR